MTIQERKNTFSGLAQIWKKGEKIIPLIKGRKGVNISGKYSREKTLFNTECKRSTTAKK